MARQVSDEDVLACFAEAQVPVECWFLLDGLVCVWDPINAYIGSEVIEDDDLGLASENYLRRHGMVFPSLEAVEKHAAQHRWPNYHLMPRRQLS